MIVDYEITCFGVFSRRSNGQTTTLWCTLPGFHVRRTLWARKRQCRPDNTVYLLASSEGRRNRPENVRPGKTIINKNKSISAFFACKTRKKIKRPVQTYSTRQESYPPYGSPAHITESPMITLSSLTYASRHRSGSVTGSSTSISLVFDGSPGQYMLGRM